MTINLTPAFGILWTAVAGFIAYSHYKNAFTNEGMATHEIVIDENDDTYSAVSGTSDDEDIEVKLKKLESLYNQGLITHAEFEQKRKEIIDRFIVIGIVLTLIGAIYIAIVQQAYAISGCFVLTSVLMGALLISQKK